MQELFTHASIAVELLGAGYVAGSFVVYAHRRIHQQPVHWQPRSAPPRSASLRQEVAVSRQRQLSPVERLRQQCQQAGIKWRDAHGKNKHLKKAEMIAALQQLEQDKRSQAAKAPVPNPQSSRSTVTPKRVA